MKITKNNIYKLDTQTYINILSNYQNYLNKDDILYINELKKINYENYNKKNFHKILEIDDNLKKNNDYINFIENKYNFKVRIY